MKVYLLYIIDEREASSREFCSIFYTPLEIYSTPELRENRKKELLDAQAAVQNSQTNLQFEDQDVEIDEKENIEIV